MNIIVGALSGYHWDMVETWWRSIKLTVNNSEVHCLLYKDKGAEKELKRRGVVVHKCQLTHPQVVVSRFLDLAKLCRVIKGNPFIIFTDMSDLIFQRDPNRFLETVNQSIVVASEGVSFAGNKWANKNLSTSFPEHYKLLKGKDIYNAGSIAVKAKTMAILAEEVYTMCMNRPKAENHDQAALNYLIQTKYKEDTLFTDVNGPWCFNAASSLTASNGLDRRNYSGKPVHIKSGKLYNDDGTMPCMFHHWNRRRELNREVKHFIYKEFKRRFPNE